MGRMKDYYIELVETGSDPLGLADPEWYQQQDNEMQRSENEHYDRMAADESARQCEGAENES